MKKLYFLAAAALTAVSMNAQSLYLMGSGEGLTWDQFPGKEVAPNADGSYSFTIANLTAFKMSTARASGWDDFNASAFGYSGSFGDAVYSSEGQTVSLEPWGENQQMPETGSYTINVNSSRSSMTVKANFSKPTSAPAVFLRGDMNSWGTGDAWKFNYDGNSDSYSWSGTIGAGVNFKIADANWGNINYSSNNTSMVPSDDQVSLVYNQQNMAFAADFTGKITFKITDAGSHTAYAIFSTNGGGDTPVDPNPNPGTAPETLYLLGNVNGLGWGEPVQGIAASNNNGVFTWTGVTVNDEYDGNGYMNIATAINGGWDDTVNNANRYGAEYGDAPLAAGQTANVVTYVANENASSCASWKIPAGVYTFTFDFNAMTITATANGDTPVDPNPNPNPGTLPAVVYLIGNVNGLGWGEPIQGVAANNNGGVYTWSSVNIDDAGSGKGYFAFATIVNGGWDDTVNTGDRYGAPASDTPIAVGTPMGVTLYAAGVDASASQSWMANTGVYDIKLDLNNLSVELLTAGTSAVEGIEALEGEAEYYNLQGVRVANPERGIFVKVVNGKAVKVVK